MSDKPVWRLNTGRGVPSDRAGESAVLYARGVLSETGYNNYNWSLVDEDCYPIVAYQTTRTRRAKYEKCHCCNGEGFFRGFLFIDGLLERCAYCNGSGRGLLYD